jgi:hypothetical protein
MAWDKKATVGQTETSTGFDTVAFKENKSSGEVLVSRGDKLTDDHGHSWFERSSEPGHRNDSTGVFKDFGYASKPPRS